MFKVKSELGLFVFLALIVTSILLFLFFRSFKVVTISIVVVIVGVIWSMGVISLFGYEITALTGLIPPLIIVIGIPNCVYLINKYQQEFKNHGNKIKALDRVIQKVGNATFLTKMPLDGKVSSKMTQNGPQIAQNGLKMHQHMSKLHRMTYGHAPSSP